MAVKDINAERSVAIVGAPGRDGQSNYEIWISQGNIGTPEDFLSAQKGTDGTDGRDGQNGNQIYYGDADTYPASPIDVGGTSATFNLRDIYRSRVTGNEWRVTNISPLTWNFEGNFAVIAPTARRQTKTFSALGGNLVGGQTLFTLDEEYVVGFVDVVVSGYPLEPYRYTATDGTTVTINDPVIDNTDVVVVRYYTVAGSISGANPDYLTEPTALVTTLGRPATVAPPGARWDIMRFPTARMVAQLGRDGDFAPIIQRAFDAAEPLSTGPGNLPLKQLNDDKAYVTIRGDRHFDIECDPQTMFCATDTIRGVSESAMVRIYCSATNPPGQDLTYDNVMPDGTGAAGQRGTTARSVWRGGTFSARDLTNRYGRGGGASFGMLDIYSARDYLLENTLFDGGYTDYTRYLVRDANGVDPGNSGYVTTYAYTNGWGQVDSCVVTHYPRRGVIRNCGFIGAEDCGLYLSGVRAVQINLPTNPVSVTMGSNVVTVATSGAHGGVVGDPVAIGGPSPFGGSGLSGLTVGGLGLYGRYVISAVPTPTSLQFVADATATSTTTGGGTDVALSIAKSDALSYEGGGYGESIQNCWFYRCNNGIALKRNARFLRCDNLQFFEGHNGIFGGAVSFAKNRDWTDPLSHGKRFDLNRIYMYKMSGIPVNIIGSTGDRINGLRVSNFGKTLYDPSLFTGVGVGNNIAAVTLQSCADVQVTNVLAEMEDPAWVGGAYDRGPMAVYVRTSPFLRDPCRDVQIGRVKAVGLQRAFLDDGGQIRTHWSAEAAERDCRLPSVYLGIDTDLTDTGSRALTPSLAMATGSVTAYTLRSATGQMVGGLFAAQGQITVGTLSTSPAPSGRCLITAGVPVNRGTTAVPVSITRIATSTPSGAGGRLYGLIDPGKSDINLYLDNDGVRSDFLANHVVAGMQFVFEIPPYRAFSAS